MSLNPDISLSCSLSSCLPVSLLLSLFVLILMLNVIFADCFCWSGILRVGTVMCAFTFHHSPITGGNMTGCWFLRVWVFMFLPVGTQQQHMHLYQPDQGRIGWFCTALREWALTMLIHTEARQKFISMCNVFFSYSQTFPPHLWLSIPRTFPPT